ncbi:RidA family protein [Paenibacillus sp. 1P03SA]|uniref:RidA family protein n=1 Tax=Paenibacillus sp. 1P03SA TaxID=3132294 RepID=UPI00399F4E31
MENSRIIRKNPAGMHSPVGHYTHLTKIPRNAELYVTSGQIGADPDGKIPDSLNEQIRLTFENIHALLHSEELTSEHIIKVNIWATQKIDWDFLDEKWTELFGGSYPAMTVAYITELGLPELKIEIELWAAKV